MTRVKSIVLSTISLHACFDKMTSWQANQNNLTIIKFLANSMYQNNLIITIDISLIGHSLKSDDIENLAIRLWTLLKEKFSSIFVSKVKPDGHEDDNRCQNDLCYQRNAGIKESLDKMFIHTVKAKYVVLLPSQYGHRQLPS